MNITAEAIFVYPTELLLFISLGVKLPRRQFKKVYFGKQKGWGEIIMCLPVY